MERKENPTQIKSSDGGNTLEKNQRVTVYFDPATKTKKEGDAILLRKLRDLPNGMEYWIVRFTIEYSALGNVDRIINPMEVK